MHVFGIPAESFYAFNLSEKGCVHEMYMEKGKKKHSLSLVVYKVAVIYLLKNCVEQKLLTFFRQNSVFYV